MSHFDVELYEQAKANNAEKVKELLNRPATVEEHRTGILYMLTAMRFIKEENEKVIDLLIKSGASSSLIARTAARDGYLKEAERLRTTHNANPHGIAQGAAFGGYHEYSEKLRLNHHANLECIAKGAIAGGFYAYANQLKLIAQDAPSKPLVLPQHVAPIQEMVNKVTKLQQSNNFLENNNKSKQWVIDNQQKRIIELENQLAKAPTDLQIDELNKQVNHGEKIRELVTNILSSDNSKTGVSYLTTATRFILEGNDELVDLLLEFGADSSLIARSAALCGRPELAQKIQQKHGVHINWIAQGSAAGGYLDEAETLRKNHQADPSWIALGAMLGGYPDYAEALRKNHGAVDLIPLDAIAGRFPDFPKNPLRESNGTVTTPQSDVTQFSMVHPDHYTKEASGTNLETLSLFASYRKRISEKEFSENDEVKQSNKYFRF